MGFASGPVSQHKSIGKEEGRARRKSARRAPILFPRMRTSRAMFVASRARGMRGDKAPGATSLASRHQTPNSNRNPPCCPRVNSRVNAWVARPFPLAFALTGRSDSPQNVPGLDYAESWQGPSRLLPRRWTSTHGAPAAPHAPAGVAASSPTTRKNPRSRGMRSC